MPPRRPPRKIDESVADGPDFPDPSSEPGRVLATLIAANVPGTCATWTAPDLAAAAGMDPAAADAALAALVADRIVDTDDSGSPAREGGTLRLTVLLSPPLDAYGVVPRWGDADATPEAVPSVADALAEVGLVGPGRGRVRAVSTGGTGDRPGFEEGEADGPLPATRLFMERFERLLVECDEWRRRALAAEDRLAAAERQSRTVERRAEASQARLEAATEKLRAWGELTRRMQQLVRQADALARSRPSRPRMEAAAGTTPEPSGHGPHDETGGGRLPVATAS